VGHGGGGGVVVDLKSGVWCGGLWERNVGEASKLHSSLEGGGQ
jgi:hypothetical protein